MYPNFIVINVSHILTFLKKHMIDQGIGNGLADQVSYGTNYRLNTLSSNYRQIVYEIIIGKFQLIAANVT